MTGRFIVAGTGRLLYVTGTADET